METEIIIETAGPGDASLIADAIMEAIGPELVAHLAGTGNTREDVHEVFARLAAREDSQYSYLNSRLAKSSDGTPMGVCVSYDGADLMRLRRPFFAEANRTFGWGLTPEEIDAIPGETDKDEFYLDTLMTLSQHRGKGIAGALIMDAKKRAEKAGKPLGLLCDIENYRARKLYEKSGFEKIGIRPFAGHDMNHFQLK